MLLNPDNDFPLDPRDKEKMYHFATISFEQMWLSRNIRLRKFSLSLSNFPELFNKILSQYWNATTTRFIARSRLTSQSSWSPPPLGEFKLNFDVSFKDCLATSAIIVRNHHGNIVGAWIYHFPSSNYYYAEMEVAIQTFMFAKELNLRKT